MGCSGIAYEHFIIHELKPIIDHRYRTLPNKENTGLLGSSAAALCTLHMGMRNPDVFGKLIMMSPFYVDVQLDETSESGLLEEKNVSLARRGTRRSNVDGYWRYRRSVSTFSGQKGSSSIT
ncbi:alpha/beta hydrolase-fold protein [Paenibacillus amylolyticus]|nr:alpha/beta hydrolase-fold protein [Paenibacillus amylolyticus]